MQKNKNDRGPWNEGLESLMRKTYIKGDNQEQLKKALRHLRKAKEIIDHLGKTVGGDESYAYNIEQAAWDIKDATAMIACFAVRDIVGLTVDEATGRPVYNLNANDIERELRLLTDTPAPK